MSRTIRAAHPHRWWSGAKFPRSVYIDREMNDYDGTRRVRRRRSDEEYERLRNEAHEAYEKEIAEAKKTLRNRDFISSDAYGRTSVIRLIPNYPDDGFFYQTVRIIHRRWVSRYTRETVEWSIDEARKYYGERYDRLSRDGVMSETSRSSGYKAEAAEYVRRANKNMCRAILKGEDYDDMTYPRYQDAKHLVWNYW